MELQLQLPGEWPVGDHRRMPAGQPDLDDLESVLLWLQDAEVNYWIGSAPPDHIAVGMHDPCGGPDIQHAFQRVGGAWPRGAMSRWLMQTARLYYGRALP